MSVNCTDPWLQICSFTLLIKVNCIFSLCFQEREKLILTRMVVFELVQVLKFKISVPDSNFLMLINFVLQVINVVLIIFTNNLDFRMKSHMIVVYCDPINFGCAHYY